MIRHSFLFTLAIAGVLGVLLSLPSTAQAQARTPQDVCLARWELVDGVSWDPPVISAFISAIDLRSDAEQDPGTSPAGWGFFVYDASQGATGMHCLGADLGAAMTAAEVNTIAVILGFPIGTLRARNIGNIIGELLTQEADPTGVTRWKPVQMTKDGIAINVYGYGTVYSAPYSTTADAFQATLDVRWADYRRRKAAGTPLEALQRQTGFDGFRLFGREPTSADLDRLIPTESRDDGYACHDIRLCTTITESFDTADSDTLGPDLSWTETGSGDIDIVSNQAKIAASSGRARADTDLAGSDMYAEADTYNDVGGSSRGNGSAVRFESAADTLYWFMCVSSGGSTCTSYILKKTITGSETTLATVTGVSDSIGGVIRLEVIGSDLEIFYAGASRLTHTDASITGNTRAGMAGRHNGANRMRFDNWGAGDLGAAPRRIIRIN